MRILTCDDSNSEQSIRVHTPNRSYPLDVVPVPASALPAGGTSGSARMSAFSNIFDVGAASLFAINAGNGFVEVSGSSLWTFTPQGCVWTYTGAAGRRFLFTLACSMAAAFEASSSYMSLALAVNGDLVGVSAVNNFTESVVQERFSGTETADNFIKNMMTTRLVAPTPGTTVQPVAAWEGSDADPQFVRATFSFAEVGAS